MAGTRDQRFPHRDCGGLLQRRRLRRRSSSLRRTREPQPRFALCCFRPGHRRRRRSAIGQAQIEARHLAACILRTNFADSLTKSSTHSHFCSHCSYSSWPPSAFHPLPQSCAHRSNNQAHCNSASCRISSPPGQSSALSILHSSASSAPLCTPAASSACPSWHSTASSGPCSSCAPGSGAGP